MRRGLSMALLALALVLLGGRQASAGEYGAAARVNGVEVSQFRLERHFEDYLREQRRSVAQIRNPSVYKRLKREALQQLIDKELLWQEARRRSLAVSDDEVARTRERMVAAFPSPDAFARRLWEAGFDEAGYADYLRREIAASRMLEQLVGSVSVSDEEVRGVDRVLRAQDAVDPDEGRRLAAVRRMLLEQRAREARGAVLQRLRAGARVEWLLPL